MVKPAEPLVFALSFILLTDVLSTRDCLALRGSFCVFAGASVVETLVALVSGGA